jgi:hypothetical protein
MKWYVFDEFDCFDEFNTAAEAAAYAEMSRMDDIEGIHIVLMTKAQQLAYCKHGDLKKALALK